MKTENFKQLNGRRFGRWLVLPAWETAPSGEIKWQCRCDCGTEKYVLERSLLYGGSRSCGCARIENAVGAIAYELTGKTFGELRVLRKAEKQRKNGGVWWTCVCSCGNLCDQPATLLVTGKKTHCGCKTPPKNHHYADIAGKKFNRITALYPTEKRQGNGTVVWHCRCDCGNVFDVSYNELVYGNLQSCGCRKREHDRLLAQLLTHVDGTSVDILKSKKLPADNTTGVKGVYFQKGKWVAKIVFQKKQYHLGKYDTLEDAAKVRRDAEVLLFDGAVSHYERWKARADSDPAWAAQNPIEIRVSKKSVAELEVVFLPVITYEKKCL